VKLDPLHRSVRRGLAFGAPPDADHDAAPNNGELLRPECLHPHVLATDRMLRCDDRLQLTYDRKTNDVKKAVAKVSESQANEDRLA
jgi:hypothetical protein